MKKIVVDILLLILMLLEFSRAHLSPEIHEIMGIGLIILIILHLALNRNYLKAIPKGKYNAKRTVILISNIAFMIVFFLTCILGLLSSQKIMTFMNIGNMTTIYLHKITSYIGIILLGVHLGINLNRPIKRLKEKIKSRYIIAAIYVAIIILGAYSFIQVDFYSHLTGQYGFGLAGTHIVINVLEYLAVTLMITVLTNTALIYGKILN